MSLTIKYGNYTFSPNPLITVSVTPDIGEDGQIRSITKTWRLEGALLGQGAIDLQSKWQALRDALMQTGQKAVVLKGSTEILSLDPDEAIKGPWCGRLEITEGAAGAWITNVRYAGEISAVFALDPSASSGLNGLEATLSVSFEPNGLSVWTERGSATTDGRISIRPPFLLQKQAPNCVRRSISVEWPSTTKVTWNVTDRETLLPLPPSIGDLTLSMSEERTSNGLFRIRVTGQASILVREVGRIFPSESKFLSNLAADYSVIPSERPEVQEAINFLKNEVKPAGTVSESYSYDAARGTLSFTFEAYRLRKSGVARAAVSFRITKPTNRLVFKQKVGSRPVAYWTGYTKAGLSVKVDLLLASRNIPAEISALSQGSYYLVSHSENWGSPIYQDGDFVYYPLSLSLEFAAPSEKAIKVDGKINQSLSAILKLLNTDFAW